MEHIESRHELPLRRQLVDIRPTGEKIAEWLSKPLHLSIATVPMVLAMMAVPVLMPLMILTIAGCVFAHIVTRPLLPFRYPKGVVDPRTGKEGDGIMFFGNIDSASPYENFKEAWGADDDLRKHMVILGSTGSGKSETLKSIFFNALAWSSGFFIADGKADNKLPVDVYSMVRSVGRDQDLLVLNFLMAGKTPEQIRLSRRRRSNGLNPFSSADPDTIIQMGANLLPKVEGDAKNWQEKALNLWRAMVTALCYLRDTRGRELSIADFVDYLALPKIEELYMMGYEEAMSNNGEWSYGFVGVKNYLESGGCPGFQVSKLLKKHGYGGDDESRGSPFSAGRRNASGKDTEQDSHAYEQHAYRTSQLMPALNLLDKSYGYIFRRKYPEIDMTDVALRNRILVMMIPSLEKSAQEAESLGKLTIACLRVMMSKNLGSDVEGSYQELILDKATQSPYPYIAALDELAYYFSDGIAVMFAQARSLGMCMIAAAQDLEKLTEGTKAAEVGAMIANTASKYFMRNDDWNKTPEMVQKILGKALVAVRRSFKHGPIGYQGEMDVEIREEERISLKQMQFFKAGQGIFNQGGQTRMLKSFFVAKDLEAHRPKTFRINRFLQVATPSELQVRSLAIQPDRLNDPFAKGEALLRKLRGEEPVDWAIPESSFIRSIADAAKNLPQHAPAHERAAGLYLAARKAILARRAGVDPAGGRPGVDAPKQQPLAPQVQPAMPDKPVAEPEGFEPDFLADLLAKEMGQAPAPVSPPVVPEQSAEAVNSDADEMIDPLEFLKPMPFERKPASELLLDEPSPPSNSEGSRDEPPLETAVSLAIMDPMQALLAGGKAFNMGAGDETEVQAGESVLDRVAGEDSWIKTGIENANRMLQAPRSSDNTVVGLTKPTLDRIAQAEQELGNPAPDQAAKTLEKAVSARVTPETQSTTSLSEEDLDAFFHTLRDSVN